MTLRSKPTKPAMSSFQSFIAAARVSTLTFEFVFRKARVSSHGISFPSMIRNRRWKLCPLERSSWMMSSHF